MSHSAHAWLKHQPIAHRGLHDEAKGIVENTLTAFEEAARADYAIELDVLPTADGEAVVFHDTTLERLTFVSGEVAKMPAADLTALPLKGTADRIPTLETLLWLIRGRVPLLIELKSYSRAVGGLEARVAECLRTYDGPFAVQSFNPLSMEWFARHEPDMARGQLSMNYSRAEFAEMTRAERFAMTNLLLSVRSRPHFIAYEAGALPAPAVSLARGLGLPVIAWTVRSKEEWERIRPYADNLIFEGFRAR